MMLIILSLRSWHSHASMTLHGLLRIWPTCYFSCSTIAGTRRNKKASWKLQLFGLTYGNANEWLWQSVQTWSIQISTGILIPLLVQSIPYFWPSITFLDSRRNISLASYIFFNASTTPGHVSKTLDLWAHPFLLVSVKVSLKIPGHLLDGLSCLHCLLCHHSLSCLNM